MTGCKCTSDQECPPDEPCADWMCTGNLCKGTFFPDGHLLNTLQPGDCKKQVCQGGIPKQVDDTLDVPSEILGDCLESVCNGQTPSTKPNDADTPANTGCVTNSCSAGMVVVNNAQVGTSCMSGVCNAVGACVNCLLAAEWDQCKMKNMPGPCPVPKCGGELCAAKSECAGECIDGVCCNTTCTEECKSCNVMGSVGTCTNIPTYQEDDSYGMGLACTVAISGSVCNGVGTCLRIVNSPCTLDSQCFSGKCASMKCLGAAGEICNGNAQCVSMMCVMGACK